MELAQGFVRRGHEVVVFSPQLGDSAAQLIQQGVTVTDRLDQLEFEPEIIHGNHSVDLVQGLVAFPDVPGIFVCHNPDNWICSPPDISRVRAFVSVDRVGSERIAHELPRVRESVRIVHNAVDLECYHPRQPLPRGPKTALVLSKFSGCLPVIRAACAQAGLDVEAVGPGVDFEVDDLPRRLRNVDIVFATARMAIEAMAVGCAVILVDDRGLAGLVTDDVVNDWREDNFGRRLLTREVTVDALVHEILRYDATVGALVAANVRSNNSLDRALSSYETIYMEAIGCHHPVDPRIEAREMSRLMRWWLPTISGIALSDPARVQVGQARSTSPVAILLEQIEKLTAALKESDIDRSARLESIQKLTAWLQESELDRHARLEQIHKLTALLNESELDRAELHKQVRELTHRSRRRRSWFQRRPN